MKKKALLGFSLSSLLIFGNLAHGQESAPAEPNEKATRYHKLLLKKPGNATVFSRFVDAWLDTGDKKQLRTFLEESAKNGGVADYRVLASLHEYLGEEEAAIKALGEAVKKEEKNPELRLARAKLHAKLLAFEAALEDLKVASEDEKLGVEASKLKGIYLARAGRIDDAVKAWKKVIERYPKDEELREDLIEVEVAEGLYDDAIATSLSLVKMTKDPYKKALRQLRLGDIQVLGNKRTEGLETYGAIMSATGADTWLEREVLAQLERVFMRDDDVQGLRDFFQKLREAHPRRVSVRKALARQMALNGEMEEAVALFREVLKITPGDVGNREEFIAFLEINERWKDAKEELNELIKQKENDPILWERMAGIESKMNNEEGVKTALAKIRNLKKDSPDGLIAVATLYIQAELMPEAEALLREGRTTFADSDEVQEALASFLVQNKKEAEALEIWTAMAKTADREGILRVTRSLTGHGKGEEAFKLLQERLKTSEDFRLDPLVLTQFCSLALSKEEAEVALPYGLELVRQSENPTDLEAAIRTAVRVALRAKKQEETLADLEKKADATISEQCLIAEFYAEQGDSLKALQVLEAAEKMDQSLLARFYRVRFEESRGELDAAVAALREILEIPEGRKTVHMRRLVGLLERGGNIPDALKAVDDWKRMAPGDQAAWNRRAELLSDNGEPDQAVLELRRMIGKFGAEEGSRAKLASALLEANEHRSAQRIFEQLYEEGEDLTQKLKWVGELARVARQEGLMDDLLADFERRKRVNPKSVAPLLAIAEIHGELNQYEERRSALLEASRRRPNDVDLLQNIARVEERAGEFDRAVGLLRDAAKRDTTSESKRSLAKLFLKNGEFQEGLRILKEIPNETKDPRNIEKTTSSLLLTGEWDIAAAYIAELLPLHPQDWRLKYLYALTLVMDGREDEAFPVYLSLMEVDTKTKGLKPFYDAKKYSKGYWGRYLKSKKNFKGWAKMQIFSNIINREEENLKQRTNSYRNHYGPGHRFINLPGTPQELSIMSFHKASALASSFEEAEKDEAFSKLSVTGVERPDLFLLQRRDRKELFKKVSAELDQDPDNPRLLQIWMNSRYSLEDGEKADQTRLAHAMKVLGKEGGVDMANQISSMLYRKEIEYPEAAEILANLLKTAPDDDNRDPLVTTLLRVTLRYTKEEGGDAFDVVHEEAVKLAMLIEKKPQDYSWMNTVLNLALHEGKADEAITLTNRLSKWMAQDKINTAVAANRPSVFGGGYSPYRRSGRGNQGAILSAPVFPPRSVMGAPNSIVSSIASELRRPEPGETSSNLKKTSDLLAQLNEVDKKEAEKKNAKPTQKPLETFKGRSDEIENLILRALVATALGDDKAMPKFLEGVTESTNPEELSLAAGYYMSEEDELKAYQTLVRLRMLTLSRRERKQVDGQLAFLGTNLTENEELKPEQWDSEPAKRAALRLRKVFSTGNERPALMRILTKLGLQKEAEKMAVKSSSGSRSMSGIRRSNLTGKAKVIDLVKNGKKEEASREAAKLLKMYTNQRHSSWERQQLLETIGNLGLTELTLKRIHPGEGKSVSRRIAYASVARLCGKPELARPVYAQLVKDRPKLLEARAGLLMCTPKDERDYKLLLGQDDENFDTDQLSAIMIEFWQSAQNDVEETIVLLDLTAKILTQLPPSPETKVNLSWVNYNALGATRNAYYNGVQIGQLFTSRNNQTFDKEVTKRRDAAALAVFRSMLSHPQTAEQGFMLLQAGSSNLDIKKEELLELAKSALRERLRKKPQSNSYRNQLWIQYTTNGSSYSGSQLELEIGPLEYLMSNAPAGKAIEILDEELMAALKESQPQRHTSLITAKAISEAAPEERLKLYEEWKKTAIEKDKNALNNSVIVKFADDLLLFNISPGPMAEDLEEHMVKLSSDQWNDPTGWSRFSKKWLRWVSENQGADGVKKFIIRCCEAKLGSQEKWHILAELGLNKLPQQYSEKGSQLGQQLQGFLTVDEAVAPIFTLMFEHKFEKFVRNLSMNNVMRQVRNRLEEPDDLVTWINSSHLFNKLSTATEEESGKHPARVLAAAEASSHLNSNGDDYRKKMHGKLDELQKDESLDPLLLGILKLRYQDHDDGREAIAKLFEGRVNLLKGMLETDQVKTKALMDSWFPGYKAKKGGPKLTDYLKELESGLGKKVREEAEKWLADGIELDENDYLGRKLWAKVKTLAKDEPKLAGKIAGKILMTAKDSPNNNRGNRSYGGISMERVDYWNNQCLGQIFERDYNGDIFNRVEFLHALYHSEAGEWIIEPAASLGNNSYYNSRTIEELFRETKIPEGSKRKKPELIFSQVAERLSPDQQATFIAYYFQTFANTHRNAYQKTDELIAWTESDLRPKSDLLADALITLTYLNSSDDKTKEEFRKKAQPHFNAILSGLASAKLHDGFAIQFSSTTTKDNYIKGLWQNVENWKWVTNHMATYPNGKRSIELSYILQLFRSLKTASFDGKKEAAQNLLQAVDGTLLTPELLLKFRNNSGRGQQWVTQIVPLALSAGDQEMARRIIKQNIQSFRGLAAMLIFVTESLDVKDAARLIAAPTQVYKMNDIPWFHKGTPELIKSLTAIIPERDRYRVEVVLSSLRDADVEKHKPEVNRTDRLVALAKRFTENAPKDASPRWQILNILSTETKAAKILMEHLKKESEAMGLMAALTLRDQGNGGAALVQINKTYLNSLVDAHDYEQVISQFEEIAKVSNRGNIRYYAAQIANNVLGRLNRHLVFLASKSREKAKELLPMVNRTLEIGLEMDREEILENSVWTNLITHTLAGEAPAFFAKLETRSENHQETIKNDLGKSGIRWSLNELSQNTSWKSKDHAKERLSIAKVLLNDPTFLEKIVTEYTILSTFLSAELYTREELYQVIDSLPEDHPRRAEFIMEKAGITGWREKDKVKEADALYEKSYKLALKQNNKKIANLSLALRARLLGQKKRIKESWKYGSQVDRELLSESDQKWFDTDSKKWKKAAEEKPEEESKTEEKAPKTAKEPETKSVPTPTTPAPASPK